MCACGYMHMGLCTMVCVCACACHILCFETLSIVISEISVSYNRELAGQMMTYKAVEKIL